MKFLVLFILVICFCSCSSEYEYFVTDVQFKEIDLDKYDLILKSMKPDQDMKEIYNGAEKYCHGKSGNIVGIFICKKEKRLIILSSHPKGSVRDLKNSKIAYSSKINKKTKQLLDTHLEFESLVAKAVVLENRERRIIEGRNLKGELSKILNKSQDP